MEFAHYEILRKLATGGMAELFLARQKSVAGFQRNVVVKRILSEFSEDRSFVESFINEARLAAQLNHPNIVQIYDLGLAGKSYFIAMEYIKGFDLSTIIRTCKREGTLIPIDVALSITADVLNALNYAHEATDHDNSPLGIVHRDVSPSNILITVEGQAKVVDFGIAKATAQREKVERTRAGTVKGKVAYLAPEQVLGTPIDRRVDVFAAGIVCHEVLTLQNPFRGDTDYVTLRNIVEVLPARVDYVRADVPEAIANVVHRAMAADPTARYASCAQFLAELEAAAHKSGISLSHSATRAFVAAGSDTFSQQQSDAEVLESTSSEMSIGDVIGEGSMAGPTLEEDEEELIPTSLSGSPLEVLSANIRRLTADDASQWEIDVAPKRRAWWPFVVGGVMLGGVAWGARALFFSPAPVPTAVSAHVTEVPVVPPAAASLPASAPAMVAPAVAAKVAPVPAAASEEKTKNPDSKALKKPRHDGKHEVPAKPTGPPGKVRFSIQPWAEVEVDGHVVGITPMRDLELAPGVHRVVLRNSELDKVMSIKVEAVSGKEVVVRRNLAE